MNKTSVVIELEKLIGKWSQAAQRRYRSAERAPTPAERDHIASGALVYFNCKEELQKLADALAASRTPPRWKARKTHQV